MCSKTHRFDWLEVPEPPQELKLDPDKAIRHVAEVLVGRGYSEPDAFAAAVRIALKCAGACGR